MLFIWINNIHENILLPKMRSQTLYPFLLLLFFFFFFQSATPKSLPQLKRGDSLSLDDYITSTDNSLTCGFLNLDNSNAYWFAIWFTNSKHKTIVWTANRDRPVNSRGSEVRFQGDGTMVLTDVDGTVVWQTNTTTTDVARAKLLNSGNLVLENPQGHVLWQSFDFPTDTLLPLQTLTKNKRLTSALRKGRFESGYFNFYFGSDNVLRLISDTPDSSSNYWPNPYFDVYQNGRTNYNISRVAFLDEFGRFWSSDHLQINASDMGGHGIKRRMTIDYDGNLRIYSLVNSTGLWDITWQALSQTCSKPTGLCGKNAICVWVASSGAQCACLPGFQVNDQSNWNAGCKPMFNESLLRTEPVTFLEIPHTDFYGFDLNTTFPFTLEACHNLCVSDSRCLAFSYRLEGPGRCYLKNALVNGFEDPGFQASIYLKIPRNVQPPNPSILYESNKMCGSGPIEQVLGSAPMHLVAKRVKWIYIYSFCAALGVIEVLFFVFGWWFLFRLHGIPASVEAGYHMISSNFKRYTYAELKKATKNFKHVLGRGGSGTVYRGTLSDGRQVAVKKLGDVFQAQDEYSTEISIIGNINHINLVRMWGFCSRRRHRLLVYEYIENLSLDRHLFDCNVVLTWKQRFAVAIGTAKGLAYLHHECLEWIIHCDVKPENILLDREFQPKIADFGLARLSQRGGPGSEFTKIRGTKGYLAPEWALNHPITAKVDVYGYGVVILEMVRGIRISNWEVEEEYSNEAPLESFVTKVKNKIESGNSSWVESFVDPRLNGEFSRKEAETLVKIGLSCVDEVRNKRPTMASVVQTLLEFEDLQVSETL